jgi:hypothetical protein
MQLHDLWDTVYSSASGKERRKSFIFASLANSALRYPFEFNHISRSPGSSLLPLRDRARSRYFRGIQKKITLRDHIVIRR